VSVGILQVLVGLVVIHPPIGYARTVAVSSGVWVPGSTGV
jgi:hypothetical protein